MADLFDYLEWRGDISVSQVPLSEADYLVIGCFSYFPFDGIVPEYSQNRADNKAIADNEDKDDNGDEDGNTAVSRGIQLGEAVKEVRYLCGPEGDGRTYHLKEDPILAEKLEDCQRFTELRITDFINIVDAEKVEQFSAFTLLLPDESPLVVFRGTDKNLVGWKEDFNMAFNEIVPSQIDALEYLRRTAERYEGDIRICGHSKGGNLAIYSSSHVEGEIQDRIKEIWNLDGPGFLKDISPVNEFRSIINRLHSFIPQLSVVGMLFEQAGDHNVIKSDGKGFWQHSLYTWKLRRSELLIEPDVDKFSRKFSMILKQWLLSLDYEKREKLVEGIFGLATEAGAQNVEDFKNFKTAYNLVLSIGRLDDETKNVLTDALKVFYKAMRIVSKTEREIRKLSKPKKVKQVTMLQEAEETDEADFEMKENNEE